MRFKRQREIPQLSSSSMADIAFLLLTFFLLTSSLETDYGFYRSLTPAQTENILKKNEIKERNLLTITLLPNNTISANEEAVSVKDIRSLAKLFIANPDNLDYLPEKETIEVPVIGEYSVTDKHVIELVTHRMATYEEYIAVINELIAAYNELREELSRQSFGKKFSDLSEEQQEAIRLIYPIHISENEISDEEVEP